MPGSQSIRFTGYHLHVGHCDVRTDGHAVSKYRQHGRLNIQAAIPVDLNLANRNSLSDPDFVDAAARSQANNTLLVSGRYTKDTV